MQIEKGFTDWLQPTVLRKSGCVSMLAVSDSSGNRALSIGQARYRRGEKEQLGKYSSAQVGLGQVSFHPAHRRPAQQRNG